ncbi:MAG: hypothetical protein ACK400_06955, partial [Pseudanabaena sp.]
EVTGQTFTENNRLRGCPRRRRGKHQNRFFESPPKAGYQKIDFYNNCWVQGEALYPAIIKYCFKRLRFVSRHIYRDRLYDKFYIESYRKDLS